MMTHPLVSIEYSLSDSVIKTVTLPSDSQHSQDVSRFDPNYVTQDALASNTSFSYSGRHDHGKLPELRSSGYYVSLYSALADAKSKLDEDLQCFGVPTNAINDNNVDMNDVDECTDITNADNGSEESALKKPRPS